MTDAAYGEDAPGFTYSHPGMPRFRRGLIRAVERISGQPMLRSLYLDWAAAPPAGETVFDAALRLLRIEAEMRWHAPAAAGERRRGLRHRRRVRPVDPADRRRCACRRGARTGRQRGAQPLLRDLEETLR